MRTSGSEGGRRKPTRENAGRAPPADPTPTCRPGRGSAAPPSSRGLFSRRIVGWATSSRMDTDNAVGALEQAIWQRKHRDGGDPRRPGPPATTDPSHLPIACTGRLVDEGIEASAGAVGSSLRRRRRPGPGQAPLQARGPFWRDGP